MNNLELIKMFKNKKIENNKYNPDVINEFNSFTEKRNNSTFICSNTTWKPIIENIDQQNNIKISIEKLDKDIIKKKFDEEIYNRSLENKKYDNILNSLNNLDELYNVVKNL